MSNHKIICGKSEIELKQFEDNTFDSCVTDPPYFLVNDCGSGFMGKDWDSLNQKYKEGKFIPCETCGGGGEVIEESLKVACPDCLGGGVNLVPKRNPIQAFHQEWATELYRVMKPGAHILVFGGTRTYHRMACAVEDAGFEPRDMISWNYGSGFPKSLDISKQLDQMNGKGREVIGYKTSPNGRDYHKEDSAKKGLSEGTSFGVGQSIKKLTITAPASEEAIQYNGFGTGLKPAHEPILLARKPISERNIASNVLKWGVGGLNIGVCRINFNGDVPNPSSSGWKRTNSINANQGFRPNAYVGEDSDWQPKQGRFPSNFLLECCCSEDELVEGKANSGGGTSQAKSTLFGIEHSPFHYGNNEGKEKCLIHTNPNCVCRMLDEQSGESKSTDSIRHNNQSDISGKKGIYGKFNNKDTQGFSDNGGASRFFYQAKASQNERWFYCTICKKAYPMKERDNHIHNAPEKTKYQYLEFHPTQKPEDLICYLMRLITPTNGTTIDPFLGSGTAIIAAEREGFNCVGIDSKQEYCEMGYVRGKAELIQQKISGERSTIERIGF